MAKPKKEELTGEDIARETLTGDLRDCLLDFLKHDKNPLPRRNPRADRFVTALR